MGDGELGHALGRHVGVGGLHHFARRGAVEGVGERRRSLLARGGVGRGDDRGRLQRLVPEPGIVVAIGERLAGQSLDVDARGEGHLRLRRAVAADAIEAEAGVEDRERGGVAVGLHPFPLLRPIPAVR